MNLNIIVHSMYSLSLLRTWTQG
ncbi:unnamed protein product [Spirodela intermedia]|uniref:Uncharacterized protein n=2 Tax=Spirodela intermedia TaxID=51605 RepID=A0A7I8J9G7_SPIIN|nr:unnamed protein product [Spirodela intermedia]CAA6666092.1 unnamed protein product [Spirodela intermedia]CAA7402855.1 unnamed protein product [Spirodela intermedia]